ncbi:MAG: TetR/AcrR family transcriptional regulator [Alphaproteobacteria bacterium]
MSRSQAADYQERRGRILDAAAELFARKGFLGASVAELAAACALSKAALYHYYPSKEDMLYDVMHSHVMALNAATQRVSGEDLTPREHLHALAREFMELYAGAADRHKVLLNEIDNLPAKRRSAVVTLQRKLVMDVEGILKAIEPRLAGARVRPAAMLFFGMINWTHTWFDPEGALSPQAFADMAVTALLGGIAKAVEGQRS